MYIEVVEVRNNDDPSGTGRVKVRAYNRENNEQAIPDDGLRWAHPILPITAISTGGIGHKPVAPPIGTRLVCLFLPDDHDRQYPLYFGCLVRSETAEVKGIQQRDPKTGAQNVTGPSPDSPSPPIA